ncbi:MAG: tRNA (adenosine(37)-N6)-threonylcarbamoyltransferase complex ATPase subunit type 1 TsaE [Acidobacteria bacterium]|nr:tRNA (adenosine(37)-N6)-threonylcarbamoyltransferase complex ATPase subunit type 1 TsaE [Acidobacteriota bacterium]
MLNPILDRQRSDEERTFVTKSAEETAGIGRRFGEQVPLPALAILVGDLGSGKTVFVKGLAAGLGIDPAEVSSPSFTLVNIYDGPIRLFHLDLYRIPEGAPIEEQLGLAEMLAEEAMVAVEWGERLRPEWKTDGWQVRLRWIAEDTREITISRIAGRGQA